MNLSLPKMDAAAWRKAAVGAGVFVAAWLLLFIAAGLLGLKGPDAIATLQKFMGAGLPPVLALPAAVAGFIVLSFLGAPQVALYAAAVLAFGLWPGVTYSWIGTEVSALIGFGAGRLFGAGVLRRHSGKGVADFMEMVGRNGLIATLMVRQAPIAPFVLINLAAGVTPMRFADYALGTGLGILPKLAVTAFLTAFAGSALARGAGGGMAGLIVFGGGLALSALVWLASGAAARAWLRHDAATKAPGASLPDPEEKA